MVPQLAVTSGQRVMMRYSCHENRTNAAHRSVGRMTTRDPAASKLLLVGITNELRAPPRTWQTPGRDRELIFTPANVYWILSHHLHVRVHASSERAD